MAQGSTLPICESEGLDDRSIRPYSAHMAQRDSDTRKHILAVGRRLSAQSGFAGMGLSELLKESGVPKGSFYHYFASKEAYGCELLADFAEDYRIRLQETLDHPSKDARSRLLAYFSRWKRNQTSEVLQDRCLVVKLSAEVADLSPQMSRILEQSVQSVENHLSATLRQGIEDGSIAPHDDSRDLASMLYHMWLGASLVAGLSDRKTALTTAMRVTRALIPTT